jgi:aprataxin
MQGAKQQQIQKQQQQQAKGHRAAAAGPAAGRVGGWSSALAQVAADPESFRGQQSLWHVDDRVVGILDKYPKSSVHGLLIARQQGLDAVTGLGKEHVPLLQHMKEVAVGWIQQQQQQEGVCLQQQSQPSPPPAAAAAAAAAAVAAEGTQSPSPAIPSNPTGGSGSSSIPPGWRLGFHSIPSMAQLHLHIITNDFNSEWLKTKKHWNSFTSPFFLSLDDVIVTLQQQGCVKVDRAAAEGMLKVGLACHKCGQVLPNMPQLKAHLLKH